MYHKDQLDRSIYFNETPSRIISLVPSQTELLVDLGLESSLVGVTKFCVHPKNIRKNRVVVGGTKQINFEKIRDLKPDVILCNKEENTLEMIQELDNIAQVHISDIYTIDNCLELIEMYGELFSVQTEAKKIILTIKSEFDSFQKAVKSHPKFTVAYFIWKDPWMVAASKTFINHLLKINGLDNVFSEASRYPEVKLEHLRRKEVNIILLSSEPYPFKEEHKQELAYYAEKARIILVDGEYFSWYGSRLIKAFDYFVKLHQEFA